LNPQDFVEFVRSDVMHEAVDDVLASMAKPPGRRPAPELVELSKWFHGLSDPDRLMLRSALAEASHAAVFGLFALLDGVRRIDHNQPVGNLELWYASQDGRAMLSGDLHDMLNSEPWHRET
jgi:hypothetical protein